jgi:hypothetical protein
MAKLAFSRGYGLLIHDRAIFGDPGRVARYTHHAPSPNLSLYHHQP